MATVAPSGDGNAPAVEVRDNGTIFNAGNVVSTGPITSVITLKDAAKQGFEDISAVGSKVVANDGTGASTTDRVGVSGAFSNTPAYNASATEWIMKGGNVSTTIGGVANTVLVSAGSDVAGAFTATRDNVNQINSTRTLGSGVTATFDLLAVPSTEINPGFTKGGGAGNAQNFIDPSGLGGAMTAVDSAAAPTRTVPGELTYRFGAPNPTQDDYKAKNVFES
jgi:hypothetical protein